MSTPAPSTTSDNPLLKAHLRIARPTPSINALLPFYVSGLGFEVIGSFSQHAGFDGMMLGHPSLPYHFEFTTQRGHDPGRAPTQDNLLVFYIPSKEECNKLVGRMEKEGFEAVKSYNPYWDAEGHGKTFEDADGWRVVLWNGEWQPF